MVVWVRSALGYKKTARCERFFYGSSRNSELPPTALCGLVLLVPLLKLKLPRGGKPMLYAMAIRGLSGFLSVGPRP
ncbi:hypothetical protein EMIT0196MI5_240042 [Pseudomonas sp. IT-196MI5]